MFRTLAIICCCLLPACNRDIVEEKLANTSWRHHSRMVVKVETKLLGKKRVANGVIISRSGQTYTVLTVNHAVPSTRTNILVKNGTGLFSWYTVWKSCPGEVVRRYPALDLALVVFKSSMNLPVAKIREPPHRDYPMFMFSHHPMGMMTVHEFSYTRGNRDKHFEARTKTKRVMKGQSGSPLFYAYNGNLAGILTRRGRIWKYLYQFSIKRK